MNRTYTESWKDYELIDAGNNKKLERWGKIYTIRPEVNAYFTPVLSEKEWQKLAHFEFIESSRTKGDWLSLKEAPTEWEISYQHLNFILKLTQFKHLGLFPEQRSNWDFIQSRLKEGQPFLNLFAYTGAASIAAKAVGADVFHCDSVKQVIQWSKENMEASGLNDIHWVLEDAVKFAQREVKRGKKYQGIIMDPPAFGLGAKKERWKIEGRFPLLVELASQLLVKNGFLIINTYSPRLKEKEIRAVCHTFFPQSKIEISTLCIKSKSGKRIEYGELTRIIK